MTIYIVSGDGPRCGSSMMMEALQAGGLEIVYDAESGLEARRVDRAESDEAQFELPEPVLRTSGFPDPATYDGRAIKVFPPPWMPLTKLASGDYRVVWLHRPATDRWASYQNLMPMQEIAWDKAEQQKREAMAQKALHVIKHARHDMDVTEVDFGEVVALPLTVFSHLAWHGWPIDPYAAATIPDPKRKHF